MTQLEKALAMALGKHSGIDIEGIVEAAVAACGCGQTVQTTPVTKVETVIPDAAKRTRKTAEKAAEPEPVVPDLVPAGEAAPKSPTTPAPICGIDLTGLFEGTGASKKVVKDVFLAAVEKAKTLAALVALNEVCDCGFATGDYTEETAGVLKRELNRWGAAQE